PSHETVQPACLGDKLIAGPKCEMVRVGQQYLSAGLAQLVWCQTFDCRLGPYGHKGGSLDDAMTSLQPTDSGRTVGALNSKIHRHGMASDQWLVASEE